MGMRATIALIDHDKSVKVTSVQWSTKLDAVIGMLAFVANQKVPGSANAAVENLFRKVTENGHISAVESGYEPNYGKNVKLEHGIIIAGVQEAGQNPTYRDRSAIDIHNYHLDGGSIGAVYDVSKPDTIEFFWDNYNYDQDIENGIATRNTSIAHLASFYGKPANRSKLKKFGHLPR